MYAGELLHLIPVPEAVDVEAWSSSGWMVCRRTLSISMTSMHWLSSFFRSASRCCVAIFSLAKRSISCSYSFSFRFRVFRGETEKAEQMRIASTHKNTSAELLQS